MFNFNPSFAPCICGNACNTSDTEPLVLCSWCSNMFHSKCIGLYDYSLVSKIKSYQCYKCIGSNNPLDGICYGNSIDVDARGQGNEIEFHLDEPDDFLKWNKNSDDNDLDLDILKNPSIEKEDKYEKESIPLKKEGKDEPLNLIENYFDIENFEKDKLLKFFYGQPESQLSNSVEENKSIENEIYNVLKNYRLILENDLKKFSEKEIVEEIRPFFINSKNKIEDSTDDFIDLDPSYFEDDNNYKNTNSINFHKNKNENKNSNTNNSFVEELYKKRYKFFTILEDVLKREVSLEIERNLFQKSGYEIEKDSKLKNFRNKNIINNYKKSKEKENIKPLNYKLKFIEIIQNLKSNKNLTNNLNNQKLTPEKFLKMNSEEMANPTILEERKSLEKKILKEKTISKKDSYFDLGIRNEEIDYDILSLKPKENENKNLKDEKYKEENSKFPFRGEEILSDTKSTSYFFKLKIIGTSFCKSFEIFGREMSSIYLEDIEFSSSLIQHHLEIKETLRKVREVTISGKVGVERIISFIYSLLQTRKRIFIPFKIFTERDSLKQKRFEGFRKALIECKRAAVVDLEEKFGCLFYLFPYLSPSDYIEADNVSGTLYNDLIGFLGIDDKVMERKDVNKFGFGLFVFDYEKFALLREKKQTLFVNKDFNSKVKNEFYEEIDKKKNRRKSEEMFKYGRENFHEKQSENRKFSNSETFTFRKKRSSNFYGERKDIQPKRNNLDNNYSAYNNYNDYKSNYKDYNYSENNNYKNNFSNFSKKIKNNNYNNNNNKYFDDYNYDNKRNRIKYESHRRNDNFSENLNNTFRDGWERNKDNNKFSEFQRKQFKFHKGYNNNEFRKNFSNEVNNRNEKNECKFRDKDFGVKNFNREIYGNINDQKNNGILEEEKMHNGKRRGKGENILGKSDKENRKINYLVNDKINSQNEIVENEKNKSCYLDSNKKNVEEKK